MLDLRVVQSGLKNIAGAATKYLHLDSGIYGAYIYGITIEGVVGHDWTLDTYIPAVDAEAAIQAKSLRDTITYLAAGTEGGLLGPFAIPFDCYLDFTNDGAAADIVQVTIVHRSPWLDLVATWEA